MTNGNITDPNSNVTFDFSDFDGLFIGFALLHFFLVVIPSVVLGILVLATILTDKKLQDPVSLLLLPLTIQCMFGALAYGLLTDIGLIFDLPLLGSCDHVGGHVFVFLLILTQVAIMNTTAYIVVVQYVTIRLGTNRVKPKWNFLGCFFLFLFLLAGSLSNILPDSEITVIRGSVCFEITEPDPTAGSIVVILYVIPPPIVIGIFAYLTVRLIKKRTIQSKKIVKNVLRIMVSTITTFLIFRFAPLILFFFEGDFRFVREVGIASWLLQYTADLSYPVLLLHILFAHKTVRTSFFDRVKALKSRWRPSNRVHPSIILVAESNAATTQ